MKRIKSVILLLLLSVFCLLPQVGECYVTLNYKDVSMPFGKVRLPEAMYIVEVDLASIVKRIDEDKTLQSDIRSSMLVLQETNPEQYKILQKGLELIKETDVRELINTTKIYQFSLYDGKSYRMAWVLSIKDNSNFADYYGDFFKGKLTQEKMDRMIQIETVFRTRIQPYLLKEGEKLDYDKVKKISYKNQDDKTVLELFEYSGFQFVTIKGKQACVSDIRVAGEWMGSFSALYFREYDFGVKNKPVGFAFLSLDSDRDFWRGIFDKALLDEVKPSKQA